MAGKLRIKWTKSKVTKVEGPDLIAPGTLIFDKERTEIEGRN